MKTKKPFRDGFQPSCRIFRHAHLDAAILTTPSIATGITRHRTLPHTVVFHGHPMIIGDPMSTAPLSYGLWAREKERADRAAPRVLAIYIEDSSLTRR